MFWSDHKYVSIWNRISQEFEVINTMSVLLIFAWHLVLMHVLSLFPAVGLGDPAPGWFWPLKCFWPGGSACWKDWPLRPLQCGPLSTTDGTGGWPSLDWLSLRHSLYLIQLLHGLDLQVSTVITSLQTTVHWLLPFCYISALSSSREPLACKVTGSLTFLWTKAAKGIFTAAHYPHPTCRVQMD